jgi:hypothetical protein
MRVGILSDSHGRHRAVRAAVAIFDRVQCAHIIHCGDVGGMEVFDELLGRPMTFVWGNTDFADAGLLGYLERVNVALPSAVPTTVELARRRIAVFHGHEPGFTAAQRGRGTIGSGVFDYLLHGHTHLRRDERVGKMRIINPGALHRAASPTVATLDLERDELLFHDVRP